MNRIETAQETISRVKNEGTEIASKTALPATSPIYGATVRGMAEPIGSCTLFVARDRHFLITAAHVVDHNEDTTLYLPGHGTLAVILGTSHQTRLPVSGLREDDHVDIAVLELDTDSVSSIGGSFLTEEDIDEDDPGLPDCVYMAVGYPLSKNRRKINPMKHKMTPVRVRIVNTLLGQAEYGGLGLNSEVHRVLKYSPEDCVDDDGLRMAGPVPIGMSGGGLWRVGRYGRPQDLVDPRHQPRLVGVLIEHRKACRAIVATRMSLVMDIIRRKYP